MDSEISHTEIVCAIRSLKNGKAPGIEGVSGEFLETAILIDGVREILKMVYDKLFNGGEYPETWATGVVQPLYKGKGSIDSPENYKGI